MMVKERKRITINGIVQGVGFRPFIYRLASDYKLKGFVLNNTEGVIIDVEGESEKLDGFIESLREKSPPLAQIKEIETEDLPLKKYPAFTIKESRNEDRKKTLISPDIATCRDCMEEMLDPSDRRYRYPFINCTNCGPRFTIIEKLPYDRKNTTMRKFSMCSRCNREYKDPMDRRFHAQPDACDECGPSISLLNREGNRINTEDPIRKTAELLKVGKIIAVKGLGGVHLACDALDKNAVRTLRQRKKRPHKPLAVMVRDRETASNFVKISERERKLLESPRAPIVLLRNREDCTLPEEIAPGNRYTGIMLPYTPLHILLLNEYRDLNILVMTSGNIKGQPIIYKNEVAIQKLGDIADYFLVHNRDINIFADDSVIRLTGEKEEKMLLRRSRGYVPEPVISPQRSKENILSCGAHQKNTFSLMRGNEIFLSHYIGNLNSPDSIEAYRSGIRHFTEVLDIEPTVIAVDMHPGYPSTEIGIELSQERELTLMEIQHHHAHIASCLVDNGINRNVIGISLDGTGYGADGNIWGGEILSADMKDYRRLAHLENIPLPGGEKAILEPWRMAAAYIYMTAGVDPVNLNIDFSRRIDPEKWEIIKKMIENNINSPLASSCGRLFDAVSSLTGIRDIITYEGQAAIELEMIARNESVNGYSFSLSTDCKPYVIQSSQVFRQIVKDLKNNVDKGLISTKFHQGLVDILLKTVCTISEETGLDTVALSGGVLQNQYIRNQLTDKLLNSGFKILNHRNIPPNDGGISAGQAVIAASRLN